MKKIIYIVFSLIILLALGVFSTKAVTYNAANGIATGGTTGVSSYNWSDYVAGGSDNDEEIWYFDGEECVKGQPAYFITSGTYNSKAECEEDNESSSQTYTGGGGLGVSWNDDYTMEWTNPTQYGAYENSYTQTQQPTIGGLEGFQISGFNDDGGLGYSASPDALTVDKNVTPGFSFDGANEFTMFGTGITHDTTINGIQPLSIGGLNTPAISTNTTGGGFSNMFSNLLKSIATDLGFKPAVSTLPTGNNLWKFTEVGDGDNILTGTGDEKKDFVFTTAEGLTDNATVPNDGTITFSWDATKNFKEGKCRLMKPMHSSFLATPTDKPLDLKGSQPIQFHITNGNDTADTAVTMKCYTKEQVTAGLKTSTNGISQSIKVKITKKEGGDTGSEDKDFTFEAKDTKLTLNKEGKAQTTLKWDIDSKIFSSCKTTAVDGTDWKEMEIERKKDGSKVVNFDKVDKEINYIFTITCETTTDKKKVINTAEVTVSKEDAPPGGDFKEPSWEAKQQINNDCSLSFKSLSTPTGSLLDAKGNLVSSLNAELVFACNNNKLEDKGSSTAVGYDARPFEYGLYIDVYNKNNPGKDSYPCEPTVKKSENTIVDKSQTETLTCDLTKFNTEETITGADGKVHKVITNPILEAIKDNQVVRVVGYIDYKTYEITGFHHGQEHTVRLTNTTDKLGVGTGPAKPPEENTTTFDITLNNPTTNKLEFKNCDKDDKGTANQVTAKWQVRGYDACVVNLWSPNNDSFKPVNYTIPNLPGNVDGTKEFAIAKNEGKAPIQYNIELRCPKTTAKAEFIKPIQFIVPACMPEGNSTPSIKQQCEETKDSEGAPMCQPVFGIGSQVILNYKGEKITKDNITDITDLKFNVKLTGPKCTEDLLKRFQKTKVNIKVDGVVIKTIEIPHNTREASFNFEDIFSQLPPNTQENIVNTFGKEHPVTGDPIQAALVNFYFEAWSTFDDTIKKPEDAKLFNCKWKTGFGPVTFIKKAEPENKAPGSGDGEEGGEGDKPSEEKPNGKNSLPPGSTGFYFKNVKCGKNDTYGEVFIADKPLNYLLEQISGFYLSSLEWTTPVPGSIITAYFAYNINNIKVDKFTSGEFQKVSEPGKYTAFLQCDKGYITDNRSWFQAEPKWVKDLSVFMYEFTVKPNNIKEIKADVKKGSFESYTSDLSFYCENCKDLCSHITIKKAGGPAITGWSVFKDNMPIVKGRNVITVPVSPRPDIKTNYQIVLKDCAQITGIETIEQAWKLNNFMGNVFANFQIKRNEGWDLGKLKIISLVEKREY